MSAPAGFEVELASDGRVISVPAGQSLIEALRSNGVEVESSCEAGTCGTCRTRYIEGEVDHQDFVLDADEQREFLMVCVSRAKSKRIKIDR
jgi:vanillate O-demethylase ferredoxin subunit